MSFNLDDAADLDSAIHQTLGFASVCWTESPTGIFESDQCHDAALQLKEWIKERVNKIFDDMWADPDWEGQTPSIGFASTFSQEVEERL